MKGIKIMVMADNNLPKKKQEDLMEASEIKYTKKFNQKVVCVPYGTNVYDG